MFGEAVALLALDPLAMSQSGLGRLPRPDDSHRNLPAPVRVKNEVRFGIATTAGKAVEFTRGFVQIHGSFVIVFNSND